MSVNKVNTDGSLSRIAGGTLYADAPIGAIQAYGGATAPSGWLLCHGQAVSRTDYAELFKAIGTAFGEGNGSTTFNVPDLRESVPKGAGLTGNSDTHLDDDGLALGEFIDDRIKEHTHQIWAINGTDAGSCAAQGIPGSTPRNFITSTGYATNEVKAVGVNYIIKAVQTAVPRDLQDGIDDAIDSKTTSAVASGNTNLVTSAGVYNAIDRVTGERNSSQTSWTGYIDYYGTRRFVITIYTSNSLGTYDFYFRPYQNGQHLVFVYGVNESPTITCTNKGNSIWEISASISGKTITTCYIM